MKLQRSITEPIRTGLIWDQKWKSDDNGLIACWERGREKQIQDQELAKQAAAGQLVILPWRGGVERLIKAKQKYGTLNYLAMWQGLRNDDLNIDTATETTLICAVTGMHVVFTNDKSKYAEP